jgi:nitrate/TMAO reductase-like tetraheme cytochrome c subunit
MARRWRRWTAAGAVLFVVGSIGSVELTSQPWFCNSCHIMEPYYTSWKTGAHRDVDCTKCHIEPGVNSFVAAKLNGLGQVVDDVLNRTSTKPSASVSQLSCTRSGCHSLETIRKSEVNNGKFRFRHDKHIGAVHLGVEISCGTCHSHVKGEEHFEVNTGVCITCHLLQHEPNGVHGGPTVGAQAPVLRMTVRESHVALAADSPAHVAPAMGEKVPPAACTTCHEPPKGEFEYRGLKIDHDEFVSYGAACDSCHRGTTAIPGPIEDGRCLECHTFGVERTLETTEMHRVHSLGRHKIECFSCHGMVRHGPAAQTMTLEQFDCRRCHIDQHLVQRRAYLLDGAETGPGADPHAVGVSGGTAAVNPMFLVHVDCTGCHTQPRALEANPTSGARVAAATAKSCDNCHQPGLGERMVPLWQEATRKLHQQASDDLAAVEKTATGEQAREHVEQARGLLMLVRVDGSWGVHNPKYTQRLLEQAREKLAAARAAFAPGAGSGP